MQTLAIVYTQASQPCRCRSYGALRLAEVRDGAPPIVVDIEIFISPQRGQVRPVIISRAPEVIPHTTTIFNACIKFRHSGVRSGLCSSPGLLRSSHTPQQSPMPVLYRRQRNLASISIENGNSPGVALEGQCPFYRQRRSSRQCRGTQRPTPTNCALGATSLCMDLKPIFFFLGL